MGQTSFLAALCLLLSSVEYAIPKPLPFLRLGLANLPIILSLRKLSVRNVLLLTLLKIVGQAIISGTLFSYVFLLSASGSIASVCIMLLLTRVCKNAVSDFGVTLAGSLANNVSQLLCARLLLGKTSVVLIAPLLFTVGFVTGVALGTFVLLFENRSKWYAQLDVLYKNALVQKPVESKKNKAALVWFFFSISLAFVFLFLRNVLVEWICVFVFFIAASIKRKHVVSILPSMFVTITLVALALFTPSGKVLYTFGNFRVTAGSLLNGLQRSGLLVGMVFLSQCAISPQLQLPGKFGSLVQDVLQYAEKLTQSKPHFKKQNVFVALDTWLDSICK